MAVGKVVSQAVVPLAIAAAVMGYSKGALADESTAAMRARAAREMGLPHVIAEAGAGFLALPGAEVCPNDSNACKRGEFSLAVGLRSLYRYKMFGFGAGIQWATTVRSDSARGAPELERDHSRSYFLVEGAFRWYFFRNKSWDVWTGASFGGVVVNDSWSAKKDPYKDTTIVGPRAATLGTEGVTVGASVGGEWSFASNWSFGPMVRYASWFLPGTRERSPTLDVASLSGRVDMFDVSVQIVYRISL